MSGTLSSAARGVSLSAAAADRAGPDPAQSLGLPHDGTEPMRRMVRWGVDQSSDLR